MHIYARHKAKAANPFHQEWCLILALTPGKYPLKQCGILSSGIAKLHPILPCWDMGSSDPQWKPYSKKRSRTILTINPFRTRPILNNAEPYKLSKSPLSASPQRNFKVESNNSCPGGTRGWPSSVPLLLVQKFSFCVTISAAEISSLCLPHWEAEVWVWY